MIRELMHDPMFLHLPSENASPADAPVIRDLMDTLLAHRDSCVGMAANMIGVRKNIIVISTGFQQLAMVNARIIKKAKPYSTEEGCLSLLGGPRPVTRYEEIEVEYMTPDFKPRHQHFSGWPAQIIQHELDHTAGVLI